MSDDLPNRERGKSLIIVEGDSELKFLETIFNSFPDLGVKKENIIVFKSNIYNLFNIISSEYGEDFILEDIDIPYVISKDSDDGKKYRKRDFINIYLIFDFDPQDPEYDLNKLELLFNCLNDETNNGKIYMNFPMFESYKHIPSFEQDEYNRLTVSYNNIKRGSYYKTLVERESIIKDYFNIDKDIKDCLINNNSVFIYGDMNSFIEEIKNKSSDSEFTKTLNKYLDKNGAISLYKYLVNKYDFKNKFLNNKNFNLSLKELLVKLIVMNINKSIYLLENRDYRISNYEDIDIKVLAMLIGKELNDSGDIYILNSMLFIIPDYNIKLLED